MENNIVWIVILAVFLVASVVGLVVALFDGSMKEFVIRKMEEAEVMFPKSLYDYQAKRRNYVINEFKEKYKIVQFILNVKEFIEYVIQLAHKINPK